MVPPTCDSRLLASLEASIRSRRGFSLLSPGARQDGQSRETFGSLPSSEPKDNRGSIDTYEKPPPAEEDEPAYPSKLAIVQNDWWEKQMLSDRSLRAMAALTTAFALAMITTCLAYLKLFSTRVNLSSTSIGWGTGDSCSTVESRNIVSMHAVSSTKNSSNGSP